ncbi:MAG: protein translocase subunit SecD [Paracoccaceae bacterium]
MLQIPLWKRVMIWTICSLGLLYDAPNFFYSRVEQHNDAAKAIAAQGGVATPEQSQALALWPEFLPSSLVNLGLDLRGGAHLLAEVQVAEVYEVRIDALWPDVRDALRPLRNEIGTLRRVVAPQGQLKVAISESTGLDAALAAVRKLARPVSSLSGIGHNDIEVTGANNEITVQLTDAEKLATDRRTLQTSLEIIRRRIDEVGTREPTIQRQGSDRVLIQVPGIGSAAELKALIGTTAKLTFNAVVKRTTSANEEVDARSVVLPSLNDNGIYYVIKKTPVVSGEALTDAQPSFDQNNQPAVSFRFNPSGARAFGDYTAANIGLPFAIVLDNEVISAPNIQSHIPGGSGIITGNFSIEESSNLSLLLRAGALPAKLVFLEERTVGPELGQDSIDAGRLATLVAAVGVIFFVWASYGLFGFFANLALALNMGLIFGFLSLLGGTLTLPGIAGIVLTIGMAVDANVLVFERIREELRLQNNPARAIELGYERALSAIFDANITTFLTAAVLFTVGTGPVRGFAVTLGVGIISSVFTAIYVTRAIILIWFAWRRPKTIVV